MNCICMHLETCLDICCQKYDCLDGFSMLHVPHAACHIDCLRVGLAAMH